MASGYRFPILNSDGSASTTVVDFEDMFVTKNQSAGLWAWGHNQYGGLGLGNTSDTGTTTRVGTLSDWKLVASSRYHAVALKTNGTLWAWGQNGGQLGIGDLINRSSPVQVGTLTNWKQVSSTFNVTAAVKTDGTLWTWGSSSQGVLGQGNLVNYSSPVQVGSLTNWKEVACGDYHCAAVKTDGTLWSWGRNEFSAFSLGSGALGLNDQAHRSSPTQVGSLTNWKSVSCGAPYTMAIKTDGTLWAWGANNSGYLGTGNTVHRSSPVQVGSLTNWKEVWVGSGGLTLAIKTDGTLWSWGTNSNGLLGINNNTLISVSSPVQIGSLTNWKEASPGTYTAAAIKTDGTLWLWGGDTYGSLLSLGRRSSPLQIGSFTGWKTVNSGQRSIFATLLLYF